MSFTRKQYIDGECSHRQYYAQFVTGAIRSWVMRRFGVVGLKASKDEHFNDIPLVQWDRLSDAMKDYLLVPGEVEYGPKYAGKRYYNLVNGVCILKEAARQIVEEA